jgi:lysozyme
MKRPSISQADILSMVYNYHLPEPVYIVGIRGYSKELGKPGVNDRGIYDDAIMLVGPNYYQTFNANTDPSRYRAGIATLVPGVHYYKKGNHGISKPGGGYPAFRPDTNNEALPVMRDGRVELSLGIAINIHRGGYNSTSSEGCQTIHPDQWLEFQTNAYKLMTQEGQRRIPYVLIEKQ